MMASFCLFPRIAVKPGDSYAGVPRLEKLLALLGDLPAGPAEGHGEGNYQGALVDAVKHFQRRHGLEPNGILDAPTLRRLNTPLSRRVTQLQLAMERMRWLPHQFDRPPIVVNIPEFRLYAVNARIPHRIHHERRRRESIRPPDACIRERDQVRDLPAILECSSKHSGS